MMKRLSLLVILLLFVFSVFAASCQSSISPTSSNTITKPIAMNSEMVHEIEKAWYKTNKTQLDWYADDLFRGMRYYGHFDGYEVLFYPTETPTDMFAELQVGKYCFKHSDTFEIFAYCNGEFYTLLGAYNGGMISKESVAAIYEIHKSFEVL